MHNRMWFAVIATMGLLGFGGHARSAIEASKGLDELIVSGAGTETLRKAVVEAEERFYDSYNQLNTDKQFDMHCYSDARTGALIKERVCRMAFYEDALALEGRAWLEREPVTPAALVYQLRYPDYLKHLSKVVSAHPELYKLLQQRNALQQRYERELKRRRGESAAATR